MAAVSTIRRCCRCCVVEAASVSSSSLDARPTNKTRVATRKIAVTASPVHGVRSISFLSSLPPVPGHSESESESSHRSEFLHLLKSTLGPDNVEQAPYKAAREGKNVRANATITQLLRREIASKTPEIEYDPARTYEARLLYESYKTNVRFSRTRNQISLPFAGSSGPEEANVLPDQIDSEVILPLLRAYSRSFIPDLPRAFSLYADVLESGTIGSLSTQATDVQMYAILIELCIRHRRFARAIRLIRDMTLFGIEQLFRTGSSRVLTANIDGMDEGRRIKLPTLYVTPRERLNLLTTLMQSTNSYAEAYGVYWRLRRLWTGIQADAIHRRLRGPSSEQYHHGQETGAGFLHWIRRITSRSDAYAYLGDGIDRAGMPDSSKEALAYWTHGVPEILDEENMASESVLLTEEELLVDDDEYHSEGFQTSRFNLTSILHRLQSKRNATAAAAALTAKMTIYATPEERQARLSASPFDAEDWKYILSTFLNLPCGQVQAYQASGPGSTFGRSPPRKPFSKATNATTTVEQVWIPAPPELVTSIFWDMLQAGVSPPPQVYTELLHYYTRLLKASRQRHAALNLTRGSSMQSNGPAERGAHREKELDRIQDRQRHFLASEAITSIHKLIYLDVNLEPDLPLINALMNAYGHLGQLDQVIPIWQSLVNLSGGARPSLDHTDPEGPDAAKTAPPVLVKNCMDAQSVSIVLDACAFASVPGALARARKVVAWVRHRDRVAITHAHRNGPGNMPAVLMSKGAWDTWLECLCRRGQLREAVQVLREEMIPILAEQRAFNIQNSDIPAGTSADDLRKAQFEPDAKTLGTLLRFAARERNAAPSSKSKTDTGDSRGGKRDRQEEGEGTDVVGGSFLGSAASTSRSSAPGNAPKKWKPGTNGGDIYDDLRLWIQEVYPHVWDEVKDIGTRR